MLLLLDKSLKLSSKLSVIPLFFKLLFKLLIAFLDVNFSRANAALHQDSEFLALLITSYINSITFSFLYGHSPRAQQNPIESYKYPLLFTGMVSRAFIMSL